MHVRTNAWTFLSVAPSLIRETYSLISPFSPPSKTLYSRITLLLNNTIIFYEILLDNNSLVPFTFPLLLKKTKYFVLFVYKQTESTFSIESMFSSTLPSRFLKSLHKNSFYRLGQTSMWNETNEKYAATKVIVKIEFFMQ